jgi:hypothetical protein
LSRVKYLMKRGIPGQQFLSLVTRFLHPACIHKLPVAKTTQTSSGLYFQVLYWYGKDLEGGGLTSFAKGSRELDRLQFGQLQVPGTMVF